MGEYLSEHLTVPCEVDVVLTGDQAGMFQTIRKAIGDREGSLSHQAVPEEERDLRWLLEGWGWCFDGSHLTGIYGDWTVPDDDERLFAALAPYVRSGSRIVMRPVDEDDGPFFAWVFENGGVARWPVEREIGYRIPGSIF